MKTTTFRTQYRKFRMLTARFFGYWFFIVFATLGVAIAVVERFTNVFGVQHLEPLMILILVYVTLVYIVTERAKVLDDIHENLRSAKTEVYPTRESVYEVFDREIDRCVASTGPGMWRVYEIYNIPDEERLDVLVELVGKRQSAEGYEVKAFAHAEGLPHLSPLVIGDEDLIIGVDDPRYYRASSAVHLRGRDPVRLATEYFYSLWNDPRIRVLKTETGVDRDEIENLRAEFRASEREGNLPLPA